MRQKTSCRDAAAVILRHIHLWTVEMTVAEFVDGTGAHHVRIAGALAVLEDMGAIASRVAPGGSVRLYRPAYIKLPADPIQEMLTGKINFSGLDGMSKTVRHRLGD